MRNAALALLVTAFHLAGCTPHVDTSKDRLPEWATGGTLHDVTLDVWATGSQQDKRATAGELLYEALWRGHLVTDEQIEAFEAKVDLLVRMTNDSARLMPQVVQYDPDIYSASIRSQLAEGLNGGRREEIAAAMGPASMEDVNAPAP